MSVSPPPFDPPVYEQDSSFWARYNAWKEQISTISNSTIETYQAQPVWRKIIIILLIIGFGIFGVLFLLYHEALLHSIAKYSDIWSHNPWSPFVLFTLLFTVSFPPLVGFSLTSTTVGALYGISFKGWSILALGSISGSVASFLLFRYVLKAKAHSLINSSKQLHAFSSILGDNGSYWLIALIRLCPFPYSLTNGALAGIPGVSVVNFALGSIITSPKLVMYLFIGDKIKDMGKAKDPGQKVFDVISIVLTGVFLTVTGWVLFSKVNQRVQELEAEARVAAGLPIQRDDNDDDDDDSLRLGDDTTDDDLERGNQTDFEVEEANLIDNQRRYKD